DVHTSVFFGDVVDEIGAVFEVRDVGRGEHDAAVVFACFLAECGEAFLTIAEIGGDDLTAIFRKFLANGGAQTADAARDDGYTFAHSNLRKMRRSGMCCAAAIKRWYEAGPGVSTTFARRFVGVGIGVGCGLGAARRA